ncbi:hypothetical protein [Microbispora hainanensis]|nr:hypothetical protein [Microbispora hainanensis]
MSPVVVRRLTGEDWCTWRLLRLAALADAPGVFHGERKYVMARGVGDG